MWPPPVWPTMTPTSDGPCQYTAPHPDCRQSPARPPASVPTGHSRRRAPPVNDFSPWPPRGTADDPDAAHPRRPAARTARARRRFGPGGPAGERHDRGSLRSRITGSRRRIRAAAARPGAGDPGEPRAAAPAQHVGGPGVLPHQRHADLLRRRHGVQPARHRPVGAQLHVHHVLRLLGRLPPAGVHAPAHRPRRVRARRGHQQLPAAPPGGAGAHRVQVRPRLRAEAEDRHGLLHPRDRTHLPGAGLRAHPAALRAAQPARLQDRHDPAGQRGGRRVGAEHPHHAGVLRGSRREVAGGGSG